MRGLVWEKSATMGLVTPIIASSAGGAISLVIIIGVIVLNYYATSRIISQAGYSPLWIVVPIAPFVLTLICEIILWHDLHTILLGGSLGTGGISGVGTFWYLDAFAFLLNWILFLVFAFSRWPVSGNSYSPGPSTPRPPETYRAVPPRPTPASPTPGAAVPPARVVPASGAGPGSGPAAAPSAPAPKRAGAQFCPWCAESLPGNRALFHDCGSKDRPEAFCKSCGKALPAGSTVCSSCAVA